MIISTEQDVTVSPEVDTYYHLRITTQSGQVLTNDILVRVLDIVKTHINLTTGGVDNENNENLLELDDVLSTQWIPTGNVVEVSTYFTNEHTKENAISLNNKGGLVFETDVYIPAGSSTLIAGISIDNMEAIEVYNDRVDSTNLDIDTSVGQYYHVVVSAIFDYENEAGWILSADITNIRNNETIYKDSRTLSFGTFNSDLGLFLATGTLPGFYYGRNNIPIPSLSANHIVCFEGESIILDASDSVDLDGDPLSYLWSSGGTGETEEVFPVGTTTYTVTVSDPSGTSATASITRTNCWMEKSDTGYTLGAVLEDVKDLFSYTWTESGRVIGTSWKINYEPAEDTHVECLITDLATGETDVAGFELVGSGRFLHAKDTNGVVELIAVYSTTDRMDGKFIECFVDGKPGFIAYGSFDDQRASVLRCKIPGDETTYKILKNV